MNRIRLGNGRAALAGAAVVLGVAAVVLALLVFGDDAKDVSIRPRAEPSTSSILPAPSSTSPPPPSSTTPTTIAAPGQDRLSTLSQIGYDGLGPIKLGMTPDEAARVARASIRSFRAPGECFQALDAEAGSGLDPGDVGFFEYQGSVVVIGVVTPKISTESGIHARTHPGRAPCADRAAPTVGVSFVFSVPPVI